MRTDWSALEDIQRDTFRALAEGRLSGPTEALTIIAESLAAATKRGEPAGFGWHGNEFRRM